MSRSLQRMKVDGESQRAQAVGKSAEVDLRLAKLTALAPSGYALGLHIRFTAPRLMLCTYDPRWLEIYTAEGFLMCDPLVAWALAHEGCLRWSALCAPDPYDILGQACAYGLNFGVAVSYGPNGSRSIGGFARADREFSDDEIAQISDLVSLMHHDAAPPERLSVAQLDALRLIANGYRHAAAAARLAISESALKARLRTARERLLCRTTAEAIQRAADNKLL